MILIVFGWYMVMGTLMLLAISLRVLWWTIVACIAFVMLICQVLAAAYQARHSRSTS